MNWQPIETVPKTRKARLVWCPEHQNTYMVWWDEIDNEWCIWGGDGGLSEAPTHWMPIPPPPKE